MKEGECEKIMNMIQEIIFEWEGGRMTSRKALIEIKKLSTARKRI